MSTKIKCINILGGKCFKCGFKYENFNAASFEFNHKDPSNKEFTIGSCLNRKWDTIEEELYKCELLCSNCHRMHHSDYDNKDLQEILNVYVDNLNSRLLKEILCPICKKEFHPENFRIKFCSKKCFYQHSKMINKNPNKPSKKELVKLIKENSLVSLGERFAVSDNTIRKWAKSYGLDTKNISPFAHKK